MNFPSAISWINPGISTSTGQPAMQPGFLHWMQRFASSDGRLLGITRGDLVEIA